MSRYDLIHNVKCTYEDNNQILEAEFHIDSYCFKFYCKPYFLHLQLPGKLSTEAEKSSYDVDSGVVCACVCVCGE